MFIPFSVTTCMAKVFYLWEGKPTLYWLQAQSSSAKPFKHLGEVRVVFCHGMSKHKDIIHVNTTHTRLLNLDNMICISLCNVAGALPRKTEFSGIERGQKVANTVFSFESGSMATCQYPEARSREEKKWEPARKSRALSAPGSGIYPV